MESRQPTLIIHIPPAIQTAYPSIVPTLRINSGRMSTPFDIYATLMSIVDGSYGSGENMVSRE